MRQAYTGQENALGYSMVLIRIERSLRDHIMKLRSQITRWNRHCTRILQSLLPVVEENISTPLHNFYNELNEIRASYQVKKIMAIYYFI